MSADNHKKLIDKLNDYYKHESGYQKRRIQKPGPISPPSGQTGKISGGQVSSNKISSGQTNPNPPISTDPRYIELINALDKLLMAVETMSARITDLERRINQRCHCGEIVLVGDYLCGQCRASVDE
jgi:hypothetical protein